MCHDSWSCQAKSEQTEINQNSCIDSSLREQYIGDEITSEQGPPSHSAQRTNKHMHIYLDVIIVWQMPIKLNRAVAIKFVIPEARFLSSSTQYSTFVYIPFLPMSASCANVSHVQTKWLRPMGRRRNVMYAVRVRYIYVCIWSNEKFIPDSR